jgi:hypothetical protein
MHYGRGWLGAVLVGLLSQAPLFAWQDAWCLNGRHVRGTLTVERGQLRFLPGMSREPVPIAELARIHFRGESPGPFRVGAARRIHLRDGQQITGQLLSLDQDTLSFRTAWASRLDLPRAAVAAVTSLPGWRTGFWDDFRAGLKAFTTTGEPALSPAGDDHTAPAVVLATTGQAVIYAPPEALRAGRAAITFQEQDQPGGARWTFEVAVGQGEHTRQLVVTLVGQGDHYEVDTAGLAGTVCKVARTAGWHRLVVQFTRHSLRILCDDDVLWYNLTNGPGGTVRQIALHCRRSPGTAAAPHGRVAFTEFSLERAVDEPPSQLSRADQDAVCLTSGDQLFGHILQADRRQLQLQASFGQRAFPWVGLQGCSFQWTPVPPRITEGPQVRLRLRSGLAAESDLLEGIATGLDERYLHVRHARLGELRIEQAWIQELRPLFHGKRIELSTAFHHLGPRGEVANLPLPRAEGLSWQSRLRLETEPTEARFLAFVLGPSGGREVGPTEVIVNDRRVDYLNRQAQQAEPAPRRVVVELPRGLLQAGDNTIELRQIAEPPGGRPGHCGVFGLALEIPRNERTDP